VHHPSRTPRRTRTTVGSIVDGGQAVCRQPIAPKTKNRRRRAPTHPTSPKEPQCVQNPNRLKKWNEPCPAGEDPSIACEGRMLALCGLTTRASPFILRGLWTVRATDSVRDNEQAGTRRSAAFGFACVRVPTPTYKKAVLFLGPCIMSRLCTCARCHPRAGRGIVRWPDFVFDLSVDCFLAAYGTCSPPVTGPKKEAQPISSNHRRSCLRRAHSSELF